MKVGTYEFSAETVAAAEIWMLGGTPFKATDLTAYLCKLGVPDRIGHTEPAYRGADKLIQRLRKDRKIAQASRGTWIKAA